jgi:hypothetical protein
LEQIAPGHTGGTVTQPRRGWLAWCKLGEVNSAGARAPSAENETRSKQHFHSGKFPSLIFGRGRWLTHYGGKSQDFVRRTKAASEEKVRRRN